jgi:hypothetical protein
MSTAAWLGGGAAGQRSSGTAGAVEGCGGVVGTQTTVYEVRMEQQEDLEGGGLVSCGRAEGGASGRSGG